MAAQCYGPVGSFSWCLLVGRGTVAGPLLQNRSLLFISAHKVAGSRFCSRVEIILSMLQYLQRGYASLVMSLEFQYEVRSAVLSQKRYLERCMSLRQEV